MLRAFCQECNGELLSPLPLNRSGSYKSEDTHHWNPSTVDRVIAIKNLAINVFLQTDAEYLFLLDSDVILQPFTLEVLLESNAFVVCEVYWTQWRKNEAGTPPHLPNVWDVHPYKFINAQNLIRLTQPGVYRVGGLGACTLIHRSVLELGVNFSKIPGVDFWGEDRHFCIRASCFGIGLFADTQVTPFHLYRKSLIPSCQDWIDNGRKTAYFSRYLDERWRQNISAFFAQSEEITHQ